MIRPEEYGIEVRFVQHENESNFVAKVAEFPDMEIYGDTAPEAYDGAIESLVAMIEMYAEDGGRLPEVLKDEPVSGRITFRMSKTMHRLLQRQASLDAVSINQWIVEAVSERLGRKKAEAPRAQWATTTQARPHTVASTTNAIVNSPVFYKTSHLRLVAPPAEERLEA